MKSISISCVDALNHTPSAMALKKTADVLEGVVDIECVYWFSDAPFPISDCPLNIRWHKIPRMEYFHSNYNYVALKMIPEVVETEFNLIIQSDGFAVNREAWTDEFFEYDYIGAVWPFYEEYNVGNGGFSLRSKKFYDAVKSEIKVHDAVYDSASGFLPPFEDYGNVIIPEDNLLCRQYRKHFETKFGIKYAPPELADRFSIELNVSSPWLGKSLGFHGKHGIAKHYGVDLKC